MKMTGAESLVSASRISLETEARRFRAWWKARSMSWASLWVVSSSARSLAEMQTTAKCSCMEYR